MNEQREQRSFRVLLGDAGETTTAWLEAVAEKLDFELKTFPQPALLAAMAAKEGGHLVVIAEPSTLAPLERLRNDPRTRHIPVILLSRQLTDKEAQLNALAAANQILDYPPEQKALLSWVEQGLRGSFARNRVGEFQVARVDLPGEARWLGRVSWASHDRVRFESNIRLEEETRVELEGPLLDKAGLATGSFGVHSVRSEDVFYNHAFRHELVLGRVLECGLGEIAEAEPLASAPRKRKIGLLCPRGPLLTQLAASVDLQRYAIRWIPKLEKLGDAVSHIDPAVLLVDPEHPEFEEPAKAGALLRLSLPKLPILPTSLPEETKLWEKLGERCPLLEVPELGDREAWTALLDKLSEEDLGELDPTRRYLRRDHRFSHARFVQPVELLEISEVGGTLRTDVAVAADARVRIDCPELLAEGLKPLHGRVLAAGRAGEPLQLVWMGVGGEVETTALRRMISEVIMTARREEYYSDED